jgi:hypothetical protein
MAAQSNISKTKNAAELSLRSVIAAVDTKDYEISKHIYRLIFNETYVYRDFP